MIYRRVVCWQRYRRVSLIVIGRSESHLAAGGCGGCHWQLKFFLPRLCVIRVFTDGNLFWVNDAGGLRRLGVSVSQTAAESPRWDSS